MNEKNPVYESENPLYLYQRVYRKKHPEKVQRWRINSYVNTLRKLGFTVVVPESWNGGEQE